jgi:Acyl-coenzyme A:6-aminopenicillanic acid acyl-transferase
MVCSPTRFLGLTRERKESVVTAEKTFFSRPESYMTVRHLAIHGTNFQIGRQLGQIARERYGRTSEHVRGDSLFASARRTFMQHNYPIHWERMRGLAAAFGLDPEDNRYDLTGACYNMDLPMPASGCSAIYYPPLTTASGSGYLSRNYDFSIGSLAEMMRLPLPPEVKAGLAPVMSEPYVMEWYPEDGGYASVAIHAFDLFSGTLDGMNSAGLVVSILADEDARDTLGPNLEMHPGLQQAIGLHELQVMRLLLDTCATVGEAKAALLTIKQYYRFMPNHYLVADIAGHSFIYENSTGRNAQHVLDGNGQPQVITNHQLYQHGGAGPEFVGALTLENNSRWRHQKLRARLAAHKGLFTAEDAKADLACVNLHDLLPVAILAGAAPESIAAAEQARTVWHSFYDQSAGTVEFSFYLGEDVKADGTRKECRSEYLKFALEPALVA